MGTNITRYRRTRVFLAVVGLVLIAITALYFSGPWRNESELPMVVCLKPHDVACSDDFLFGRNGAGNREDLLVGGLGTLGAAAVVASFVWTKRLRSSPPAPQARS